MTWIDALEALRDHPHIARLRTLCAEDAPAATRDAYRTHVIGLAMVAAPPAPDPAYLSRLPPLRGCCGGGG